MAAKSKNKPTGRSNIGNQRRIAHTLALRPTHQSKCSDTSAVSGGKHPHTPHIDSPGSYGITATKTVASAAASHPASAITVRALRGSDIPFRIPLLLLVMNRRQPAGGSRSFGLRTRRYLCLCKWREISLGLFVNRRSHVTLTYQNETLCQSFMSSSFFA